MAKSNADNRHHITVPVGTQSASIALPATYFSKKTRVEKVTVIDQAGVAASNTNYLTTKVKNGALVVAQHDSRAANQGALTAKVGAAAAMAPNADGAQDVAAGSSLTVDITAAGTVTLTNAVVVLECYQY